MDGIVLVDKPKGWTSFDVVAKIRSLLRQAASEKLKVESLKSDTSNFKNSILSTRAPKVRVGHTGTLDPMATGLLIIVTGSYTKRAQEFSKLDKVYEAELILGQTSVTDDDEGEKTNRSDAVPAEEEVRRVLNTFAGEILQLPPAFSAIKVDGERAYKLARAGKHVALEPRPVTIYAITDIRYEYPRVRFTAKVSSGTYIRSLARDIGEKLGTGAYLSSLRRTSVGPYKIEDAITLEKFSSAEIHTA